MALHGRVEVNGTTLYIWTARRLGAPNPIGTNNYEATLYGDEGQELKSTTLNHRMSDGALTLAAQVLSWAQQPESEPTP